MNLPEGWFSPEDIKEYRRLVSRIPVGGTLCELGVWKGRSLCSVADIIKARDIHVYAVDTFEGTTNEGQAHDWAKKNDLQTHFEQNLVQFGIRDSVEVFRMTTCEFWSTEFISCDLVFIDADHSYEAVKNDIKHYSGVGGVIAGHDYSPSWEGTMRAVNEYCKPTVGGTVWSYNPESILAYIPTRGRTHTTLPLAIMGVINQTKLPDKLIIFDDNEVKEDLRLDPIYKHLFSILDYKGILWEVQYGESKGQHHLHQRANKMGYKYCWRIDDDTVPEPNVLSMLHSYMGEGIGAVGGAVLTKCDLPISERGSGKLDDTKMNIQWFPVTEIQAVEHLYSTFLYRAGIADYNLGLSQVAHREETLFTMGLRQEGYGLLVVPCTTYHLQSPAGGIRTGAKQEMFDHDEQVFLGNRKYGKIFILNNGLGDHWIFKSLLPLLKDKYGQITIACCYTEVFEGETTISVNEGMYLLGGDPHNIYKWCIDNSWTQPIQKAYEKMLGIYYIDGADTFPAGYFPEGTLGTEGIG